MGSSSSLVIFFLAKPTNFSVAGVQPRLQVETRPEGPHRGPLEREEVFVPRMRLRHQTVVDLPVPPAQPHWSTDAVRNRELHLSDD